MEEAGEVLLQQQCAAATNLLQEGNIEYQMNNKRDPMNAGVSGRADAHSTL